MLCFRVASYWATGHLPHSFSPPGWLVLVQNSRQGTHPQYTSSSMEREPGVYSHIMLHLFQQAFLVPIRAESHATVSLSLLVFAFSESSSSQNSKPISSMQMDSLVGFAAPMWKSKHVGNLPLAGLLRLHSLFKLAYHNHLSSTKSTRQNATSSFLNFVLVKVA